MSCLFEKLEADIKSKAFDVERHVDRKGRKAIFLDDVLQEFNAFRKAAIEHRTTFIEKNILKDGEPCRILIRYNPHELPSTSLNILKRTLTHIAESFTPKLKVKTEKVEK